MTVTVSTSTATNLLFLIMNHRFLKYWKLKLKTLKIDWHYTREIEKLEIIYSYIIIYIIKIEKAFLYR